MKKIRKFKKLIISVVLLLGVCLISAPFLVSCSSEIEGLNQTAIINLIFPNIWVFVATIIATILLLSIIIWFVWKPMNKKIDERKKFLNQELQETEAAKKAALDLQAQAKNEFIEAQTEASAIIQNANEKANNLYSEMQAQARSNAYEIVKAATEEIATQKQEMQDTNNRQILDIAFEAVTHISKQKISKEENDKLVNDFINSLEKSEE